MKLELQLMMKKNRIFTWIAVLSVVFMGCEQIEQHGELPAKQEFPLMKFTDSTTLHFFEDSRLVWSLETQYLERWEVQNLAFAKPLRVNLYDSLGNRIALIIADSGNIDLNFNWVKTYGQVFAIAPDEASVRASDSLIYDKAKDLIYTESRVRVVTENGDVLQGKGFESNARFQEWRILSDVTGIFQRADSLFGMDEDMP
jgi:LPS export ABC transporter protein LptC